MSHDTPRARKSTQRDAYASGKWFDAAIGVSWLTPKGRGPFALPGHARGVLPARREGLQTKEVCCAFAPAGSTKFLASIPIEY